MPKRSGRVYSEIFLHFVWHTKDDMPFLNSVVRPLVYDFLAKRLAQDERATLVDIGGTADHLHLCLELSPKVAPADIVKDLKGSSSHHINHLVPRLSELYWQRGYGVVSLGRKNVPWLQRYIAAQEQHHARGTAVARLEEVGEDEDEG